MIREMYAEIQKQTDKHSVSELCEIYGVSRSGYYKWLKRAGQLNRYEKTHKILDSYVLDVHSHHPMMGYRQIRDKLYLEFGWIVSDPTVWKSMKRLRIHGCTRRRKATATGTNLEHIRYGKRCGFSKRYFLVLVACRHLTCTKTECRKMFLSLIAPLTTIRLNRGKRSNRLPYIFAQGQER